jgi:hypothetical protein
MNNALDEATVVRDCNNGWPVTTILSFTPYLTSRVWYIYIVLYVNIYTNSSYLIKI